MKKALTLVLLSPLVAVAAEGAWYSGGGLGLGATELTSDHSLTFNSNGPRLINRYQVTDNKKHSVFYHVVAGKRFELASNLQASVGLEAIYIDHNDAQGLAELGTNMPPADEHRFTYSAASRLLMLQGKLAKPLFHQWRASASLSVGIAANRLYNYQETLTSGAGGIQPLAPFNNHTVNQLAYGVGVGVTQTLSPHAEMSIEARYINAGSSRFATSPAQDTNQPLQGRRLASKLLTLSLQFI